MWQDKGTVNYRGFVSSWEKFASKRSNELCFKKHQYLSPNHRQSESQCHALFLPVQAWTELFRGLFKIRISFGWWACFNTCHKMYIFQRSRFHNFRSKCKASQEGFYRFRRGQGFPVCSKPSLRPQHCQMKKRGLWNHPRLRHILSCARGGAPPFHCPALSWLLKIVLKCSVFRDSR